MAFQIEFALSAKAQLDSLTARERATVLDAIERQLLHEPLKESRNRKLLRPNPIAPWELRVSGLRVFYDVEQVDKNDIRKHSGHRPKKRKPNLHRRKGN